MPTESNPATDVAPFQHLTLILAAPGNWQLEPRKFLGRPLLWRDENENIFSGFTPHLKFDFYDPVQFAQVEKITPIPRECYQPLIPFGATKFSGLDMEIYVKKVNLISFRSGDDLGHYILRVGRVSHFLGDA